MKKTVLLVLFFFSMAYHSTAQIGAPDPNESWKKRLSIAEEQENLGNFSDATAYYMSVFTEKSKRTDLAYKVGEIGLKARRYQDVVTAMKALSGDAKKFPKASLYYALALKGMGEYELAAAEFDAFSDKYRGEDYNVMSDLAGKEMEGCRIGKEMTPSKNIKVSYLTKMVNSPQKEFAPIPFGDDILYYSSNFKTATKIYRTERADRSWKEPLEPAIFGAMQKEHFCGGSFTPNKKRFYFSQCDIVGGEYQCEIYVMQRGATDWSKPLKLPDYINKSGYTTSDPIVYVEKGQEILYFSSDREGGMGGKDIWFATKDYDSEDLNFEIPINLGENVNTARDEISPYYDGISKTLYFSSDGHVSVGGFDVFKSGGSTTTWTAAQNMGMPINSCADDTYFVLKDDLKSGFFSSNRLFGNEKKVTDNDDLFSFDIKEQEITIEGKIHEEGNPTQLINNVMVSLLEVTNSGEFGLGSNITPDGYYQFVVSPDHRYKITIELTGYDKAAFEINMADYAGKTTITKDLALKSTFQEEPIRENPPGPGVISFNEDTPPGPTEPAIPGGDVKIPGITTKPPGQKPGNVAGQENYNNVPDRPRQRVDAVVVEEKPPVTNDVNEPEVNYPPTKIEVEPKPIVKNNRIDENGNPIILGTRLRSELDTNDETVVVNDIEYLIAENGYYKITEPTKDDAFPGIEVGAASHYRIQLAAVSSYKSSKFENAESEGQLVTESATSRDGKDVTRVMVMEFHNFEEAKAALRRLREKGYERAFIIRYQNDNRVGRMIRDID